MIRGSLRSLQVILTGLTAVAIMVTAGQVSTACAADKLLLVSWDGVAREVMRGLLHRQDVSEQPRPCPSQRFSATMPQRCGDHWTCLPNLCGFQVIDSWDSDGKPLTRPQHAQMLSGYSCDTSGVYRNNGASRMPAGYTVYERLKSLVGSDLKTIHIAGRKYVSRGVTNNAVKSGAIDVIARRGGRDHRTGVKTTRRALPMIREFAAGPFFMLVHYKEADVTAHLTNSSSASYQESVIGLDRELGVLLDEIETAGLTPHIAVLVTTDHGFSGNLHVSRDPANIETWIGALNVVLRTDRPAKLLDVTPTILDYFGASTAAIEPPLEGDSLLPPPAATTTVTTTSSTSTSTTTLSP